MEGNFGFANTLLYTLKKYDNKCRVMLLSSIQATLISRYAWSHYEKKEAVEDKDGKYCYVSMTHKVTLGKIVESLDEFKNFHKV